MVNLETVRTRKAKRLKAENAVSTFVEPLSEAELASLRIERMQTMGLSLETLITKEADTNIGEGRGRSAVPVTFRFAVSDLAQPEIVSHLTQQAIWLEADDPETGWTVGGDLKNPVQTVAKRLGDMLAENHDIKLRVTIDEKKKRMKIQFHPLSFSEYQKRQAEKKRQKKLEALAANVETDDSGEEE